MLAVHFDKRSASIRVLPRPRRPPGYARIRLLIAGICNTDLELLRGYYDFKGIPGHEFVGEVVECDTPNLLGRRVVGEINLACARCEWCRRGLGRHCPSRQVLGIVKHPGAFRELLTLPETNLHLVPGSVADEVAVFTEPLAAACEILDQVTIPEGGKVAVLGDGKLGLLIAQVLNASKYDAQLFGHHRSHLEIARRAGVSAEVAGRKLPVAAYDWVVEATGSTDGLRQAVAMTRPRGTVIMKSTVHGNVRIDTAPVIVNEITLVGSRCGRFEPALNLLASRAINVEDMIADEYPLESAGTALNQAAKSGVLKVLLRGNGK